jgi:hypothetical protein
MAPKPFGFLGAKAVAARAQELRDLQKDALDKFCRQQQARIAADLKRRMERIAAAKWGDCEGNESHFVVSRKGTTEASGPVRRTFHNVAV